MTDQRGDRGQRYDAAMRRLIEQEPGLVFRLLGVPPPGPPPEVLQATFPSVSLTADLLLRTGRRRLMQVEYQRVGEPDFVSRMLVYRGMIQQAHPGYRLSQHVVVLKDRPIVGHDDLAANGFALDLQVVHLRDLEPENLLTTTGLSPLAVLARGTREERRRVLLRVVRMLEDVGDQRALELIELTLILATLRLETHTIEQTLKEGSMAQSIGMDILHNVFSKPAREEGLHEGRVALLSEIMHARFGDSPEVDELAERLADRNGAEALQTVNAASDLAALRAEVE